MRKVKLLLRKNYTLYAYAMLLLLAMVMASQIYKCRYINDTKVSFHYFLTCNYIFMFSFKYVRQSI